MSLVYEALQKAAREKTRFAGQPPTPAQPAPAPVAAPAAPKRSPVMWITGASLVVFAAIIGGGVMFLRKPVATLAPVTPPVTDAAPAPVMPAAVAPAPLPENSTANDARFKLTGIMKFGEEYSAVINGRVVVHDQYVDGAIVKAVERDRVTLNVDGREVVVRLF